MGKISFPEDAREIICLVVDSRAVPYPMRKKYYREKWFSSNYQLLT